MIALRKSSDIGEVVFLAPSLLQGLPRLKRLRQENLHKNKVEYYVQVRIMKYICEFTIWHLWFPSIIIFSLKFIFKCFVQEWEFWLKFFVPAHKTKKVVIFNILCKLVMWIEMCLNRAVVRSVYINIFLFRMVWHKEILYRYCFSVLL